MMQVARTANTPSDVRILLIQRVSNPDAQLRSNSGGTAASQGIAKYSRVACAERYNQRTQAGARDRG